MFVHFTSSCRRELAEIYQAQREFARENIDLSDELKYEKQLVESLQKTVEAEQQARQCSDEMRMKDQQELMRIHEEITRLQKELVITRSDLKHARVESSELFEECQLLKARIEELQRLSSAESHFGGKAYRKKRKQDQLELQ